MALLGHNGGLIGGNRNYSQQGAEGVWSVHEQVKAKRNFLWPSSNLSFSYRYWKWDNITANSNFLEVSEWRLQRNDTVITGGTWTFSGSSFSTWNAVAMTDGDFGESRAVQIVNPTAGDYIQYDHGSTVEVDQWRYAQFYFGGGRYVTGVTISGSNDGVEFSPIKTFSGLTQYATSDYILSPRYLLS
jgi:hypothetical protein